VYTKEAALKGDEVVITMRGKSTFMLRMKFNLMKKKQYYFKKLRIMALILVILASAGCAMNRGVFGRTAEPSVVFDQAAALIEKHYIDKTGKNIKLDTSMRPDISTLVAQLDSSGLLLSPEDVETQTIPSSGAVGIYLGPKDGVFEVLETLRNSPARKAGLHKGDKIVEIQGTPLAGFTRARAMRLLQGTPGSLVTLKIVTRSGDEKVLSLTREIIKTLESVAERLIEKNIGYLRIERFYPDTPSHVKAAVKRLLKRDMKGLVIDVRNNSGGFLFSVNRAAELFMNRREIIVTLAKGDDDTRVFKAGKWFPYIDFPIVVLIDNKTSSGAEIFAAALKESKHALLVGEKTQGIGGIQGVFKLKDGSQLRMRTSLAYTPQDAEIEGRGIQPDREVVFPEEQLDELYERMESLSGTHFGDSSSDVQLKTAVAMLTEKTATHPAPSLGM
jgi:carboxyl-terminal processing protease